MHGHCNISNETDQMFQYSKCSPSESRRTNPGIHLILYIAPVILTEVVQHITYDRN